VFVNRTAERRVVNKKDLKMLRCICKQGEERWVVNKKDLKMLDVFVNKVTER